ncbi:SulP family inorganic anion transporter [Jeongeupia naejangsanensis]|uniref:SulP family inorganic anion transporter n=1 Tax=Jeongeupia naejangsanensis TaxID=613195 RepID=A0ABS2BPS8_9NEIS|nr:SulP family inorganic anion transporter [Jeongeupia naejangsanensis]MBM3117639.1 SulP family inorganic anion transporter [Jeongeupia naejangsanensis]
MSPRTLLIRLLPGLPELVHYPRRHWRADVQAGLSVAAVALPVGVAYAQLAGFSPIVGLYSTILPMIVYALMGSSRQLVVGPDAATCAMIAATLMPLAAPGSEAYMGLAVSLTLMAGLFCMLASRFRLGFLADFLSRPILAGLLNGVAINIIIGQLGKVSGLTLTGKDVIGQLLSLLEQLGRIHWPTLLLALATIAVYFIVKYRVPRGPAALVAMAGATLASGLFTLSQYGIAVVGPLPSGLPRLVWPSLPHEALGTLVPAAAALALISFSSAMLTGRSFAAKNGYDIDANREFMALGAADVASALSQGFAISGADSRTAVNDAAGGQTRMVSIVGAGALLLVLLVLTKPLAVLPIAALGAILIASAIGLMDLRGLIALRRYSRAEFNIALATLSGVVIIGVMPGILMAVGLALLRFLAQVARPSDQLFGRIGDRDGFYELAHYPEAKPVPGLLIYRFESPLTFFNADFFRQRLQALVHEQQPRWVVIDAVSIGDVDLTGAMAVRSLQKQLAEHGIVLALAGRTAQMLEWLRQRGIAVESTGIRFYPSRHAALAAYCAETGCSA